MVGIAGINVKFGYVKTGHRLVVMHERVDTGYILKSFIIHSPYGGKACEPLLFINKPQLAGSHNFGKHRAADKVDYIIESNQALVRVLAWHPHIIPVHGLQRLPMVVSFGQYKTRKGHILIFMVAQTISHITSKEKLTEKGIGGGAVMLKALIGFKSKTQSPTFYIVVANKIQYFTYADRPRVSICNRQ